MKIMSIDLGDTRTGLAVCDKSELLASPICVLHEKDQQKRMEKIMQAVKDNQIEQVVVGYPKNMNNTVGERAQKSELFVEEFKKLSDVPIVLWDERSTTVSAISYLNDTNTRGKKRKNIVDAVAATIILENYLAFRKNIKENG